MILVSSHLHGNGSAPVAVVSVLEGLFSPLPAGGALTADPCSTDVPGSKASLFLFPDSALCLFLV